MTSPRQRKKRLVYLNNKQKIEEQQQKVLKVEKHIPVQQQAVVKPAEPKPVATPPPPVVESEAASKLKKPKTALVETKPIDQVLEQPKQEVKVSNETSSKPNEEPKKD